MQNRLSPDVVVGAVFVTSFTAVGLMVLWLAHSRRHWFLKTAIFAFSLLPLLVVPAYELFLIFTLEAGTIAAGVLLWQRFANPGPSSETFHFSLKSLLLLTAFVAIITAIGRHIATHIPPQTAASWTTILLDGLASGFAVLLAAWLSISIRPRITWPIVTISCLGMATVLAWCEWLVPTFTVSGVEWPTDATTVAKMISPDKSHPQWTWFVVLPTITLLSLLAIFIFSSAFGMAATTGPLPNVRRLFPLRFARTAFAFFVTLVSAVPLFVLWSLLNPLPPPSFPRPNPNGFDLITSAAREFDSSPILTTTIPAQSTAQLAAEVAKYASHYEKLRVGLSQDIQVRQWPNAGERWSTAKWPDTVQNIVRQASRALLVEAELAQQQKRYADAARISRDIFRLGNAASRDGNLLDYLVGIAIEGVAGNALYPVITQLAADDCHAIRHILLDLERSREPIHDAIARDRIWNQNALGWHGHLWQIVDDIAPRTETRAAVQQSLRRIQTVKRLLIVELSLRIYRLEHGALPNSLAHLASVLPEEMLNDPLDSAGGTFRYIPTADSYLLYSVGVDGQDNQGRATSRTAGLSNDNQDLRLDVFLAATPVAAATTDGTAGAD
jgi:hypothetical protein